MTPFTRRQSLLLPIVPLILSNGLARAGELNPAAVAFRLPDQIQWGPLSPSGAKNAVLAGDPTKEGLLSGTWWVGSGTTFDPDATVAMPVGTFVTHFGQQVHFDGAKSEDAVLLIVGEGPATATPAEVK